MQLPKESVTIGVYMLPEKGIIQELNAENTNLENKDFFPINESLQKIVIHYS